MIVRPATRDDVPRIVEMSERFYAMTRYAAWRPMKRECAAGLALMMMATGTMLVAESDGTVVGMIGTYIDPFTFNDEHLIAREIVWWVEPEFHQGGTGQALLEASEAASKAAGAELIVMMDLAHNPVSARLYAKRGYHHSENSYTKRLD